VLLVFAVYVRFGTVQREKTVVAAA
jgi:hypothetical protein